MHLKRELTWSKRNKKVRNYFSLFFIEQFYRIIIFVLIEEKKDSSAEQETNDEYYLHPSLLQTSVGSLCV